jgi:hypothetical protein
MMPAFRAGSVVACLLVCVLLPRISLSQVQEFNALLLPEISQIEVGEVAEVRFEVDATAMQFNAYEVVILFDPGVVEFLPPVIEGPLMSGACGSTVAFPGGTDSTVAYTHAILCAGTSLDGPGLLSTYRFQGLADGVTQLQFLQDPDRSFADAGRYINPEHPTFPRQVILHEAAIQVGTASSVVVGPTPARTDRLAPNVPNPFNPTTRIRFELAQASAVRLDILDPRGRRVWSRDWNLLPPGAHDFVWTAAASDGRRAASGVYVLRLSTERGVETRKMTLLR